MRFECDVGTHAMTELRHLAFYFIALALVGLGAAFGASRAVIQGAQFPLKTENISAVKKEPVLVLASSEATGRAADGRPIWIMPTPKYSYDPKLLEVKPRGELLKQAETLQKEAWAKRQAEAKLVKAKQRQAQARRNQRLREASNSYAYAPDNRPNFMFFPFIR